MRFRLVASHHCRRVAVIGYCVSCAIATVFLRVYGVLTLLIFGLLFVGFMVQTPLLAEHGGALNRTIWNDVQFGNDHAHVPPMLLLILALGIFLWRPRITADEPAGLSRR